MTMYLILNLYNIPKICNNRKHFRQRNVKYYEICILTVKFGIRRI